MKPFLRVCIITCAFLSLLGAAPSSQAQTAGLSGLRGGRVLILAEKEKAILSVTLSPTYGWDEKATLHAPDGRLFRKQPQSGRSGSCTTVIELDAPGLYTLRLKRSLLAEISGSDVHMAIQPLRYFTYLKGGRDRVLYFSVPEHTDYVAVSYTNRIGSRGETTKLRLTDTAGNISDAQLGSFSPGSLKRKLGLRSSNTNQALSSYAPDALLPELQPGTMRFFQPEAGVWSVTLNGGETGIWLDGVPDLLAADADNLLTVADAMKALPTVTASITTLPLENPTVPFLGVVGSFDPANFRQERIRFGVQADQIFLWPSPKEGGPALNIPLTWAKPDVPQMHTLLILRGREPWMRNHPGGAPEGFAEWAARAVAEFIDKTGRSLDTFTVQVLSEPNLEMGFNEYSELFGAVAARFARDPALAAIRLSGPALGSGDEDGFVDASWLDGMLKEHGKRMSVIGWNNYKVMAVEDAALFAGAVRHTRELARAWGVKPEIMIGGVNRMGGIAPAELFEGDDAGVWWAAVLASVINTRDVSGIWYFNLADSGMRRKGLISLGKDGKTITVKPQAYAHQAVAEELAAGRLMQFASDHDLVDGIAVQTDTGERRLLLINKSWLTVRVNVSSVGRHFGQTHEIIPARGVQTDGTLKNGELEMRPYSIVSLSVQP